MALHNGIPLATYEQPGGVVWLNACGRKNSRTQYNCLICVAEPQAANSHSGGRSRGTCAWATEAGTRGTPKRCIDHFRSESHEAAIAVHMAGGGKYAAALREVYDDEGKLLESPREVPLEKHTKTAMEALQQALAEGDQHGAQDLCRRLATDPRQGASTTATATRQPKRARDSP